MDYERRLFLDGRETAFPVSDAEVLSRFPQHRRLLCKLYTLPDAVPDHSQASMPGPFVRKPAFNPDGLGVAEVFRDGKLVDDVKPGHVLQPHHDGQHLSVDLIVDSGQVVDAASMQAIYGGLPLCSGSDNGGRPAWWESCAVPSAMYWPPALVPFDGSMAMAMAMAPGKIWLRPPAPAVLRSITDMLPPGYRGVLNIETIGGHLIDVHPRASAQFLPIWGEDWIQALDELYRGKPWQHPEVGRGRSYACWGGTAVTMVRDGSSGRAAVVNVVEG